MSEKNKINSNLNLELSKFKKISFSDLGLSAIYNTDFDFEFNHSLYIKYLSIKNRQGTAFSKDRSEVSFTNKKPWKQKGTGRARAGSARSPIWRKGGVTFGPRGRSNTFKINKSIKKNVLKNIFNKICNDGLLYVFDFSIDETKISTKNALSILKFYGLENKKINLFTQNIVDSKFLSFRNLPSVQILFINNLNAYNLSIGDVFVVFKNDFDCLKQMVLKWD